MATLPKGGQLLKGKKFLIEEQILPFIVDLFKKGHLIIN